MDFAQMVALGLAGFNFLCLFYIWCRGTFARVEFWVFYAINLGFSAFLIITNIVRGEMITKTDSS